jgi:ubiquinone/menaquinone biosynthesis C-methylase UbiE
MKKNYITSSHRDENELVFLEKFWTDRWDKKKIDAIDFSVSDEWNHIQHHFSNLPSHAKILDAGCGTGEWVHWLTQKGYNVTGIDISSETIIRLKKHYLNEKFKQGNILELDFPDNYFDLIYSWGLFEHFESGIKEPLVEANRILKPGGKLIISVPYYNFRHSQKDIIKDCLFKIQKKSPVDNAKDIRRFYQWRFTKSEICLEIINAGLSVSDVHSIHYSFGIDRMLTLDLSLRSGSFLYKLLFGIFINISKCSSLLAHMVLVVSEKR